MYSYATSALDPNATATFTMDASIDPRILEAESHSVRVETTGGSGAGTFKISVKVGKATAFESLVDEDGAQIAIDHNTTFGPFDGRLAAIKVDASGVNCTSYKLVFNGGRI